MSQVTRCYLTKSAHSRRDSSATLAGMPSFAARVTERLYRRLVELDDDGVPIAETYRRVAAEAERMGLSRPSYERIRVLVRQSRRWKRSRGPSTTSVLVDVAFRVRPPEAVLDHISGIGVPTRR
jgi:hypothetical protein